MPHNTVKSLKDKKICTLLLPLSQTMRPPSRLSVTPALFYGYRYHKSLNVIINLYSTVTVITSHSRRS